MGVPLDFDRLAAEAADALRAGIVQADERPVSVAPTAREVREVLVPLLQGCLGRRPEGRGLVGIAAPPGAGKSTFVAWLRATAMVLGWKQLAFAALDGYHQSNAVLESRAGLDPEGNRVSMRKLKGTPPTFDADRLLEELRAVKSSRAERRLPAYSRVLHEPVPDRIVIGPEVDWVVIEGNFLFLDTAPWRDIRDLLDRRVFLDADDAVLKERLTRRHRQAGRDAEWIEAHFRRTDWPNVCQARATARFADIVLRWDRTDGLKEGKAGAG